MPGVPLGAPPKSSESRRTVTVVFSDVAGSTALGESLDPEALRAIMARYFDAMQGVVESYGGVVEKFIGDAVMAVFGIPQLHEDDALRAVRAADAMRERLGVLNDELERGHGVRLEARIGVNTGEVVAGDPAGGQRLVTGDPVNVAARLEQAAGPGEILIGARTHWLVHEAIRVATAERLELKGKAEPVAAFRLLEVLPGAPAFTRRFDAPFVGRERELELLRSELARCAAGRECRLVTVLGEAGIGKSRLVRELVQSRGDAGVVVGRCLPYGEGITYWPLIEIVKQVAGDDAHAVAPLLPEDGELVAERIAAVVGQSDATATPEETFWAARKLLEALARTRPLLVVLDDLHWAEPTFLDLVEYLLAFTRAPILLLAVARGELLGRRPSWTGPRSVSLALEPLSSEQSGSLIDRLGEVAPPLRERILTAAEGNPLFVEQMVALHAQGGAEAVPPTIQALLAARIDQLEAEERAVLQRAAVEGRLFHRGAVAELVPSSVRTALSSQLLSLVRKDLIRPDQAEFPGDDAFRFGHILIRDAAYDSMPKQLRAELHERYAGWLEVKARERLREYEEILGHHLEQAYRFRLDLGAADDHARGVARRAGELLGAAGGRARARYDMPAAERLLTRALDLLASDHPDRLDLSFGLCDAINQVGDLDRASGRLEELIAQAADAGDDRTEWRARVLLASIELSEGRLTDVAATAVAQEAIGVLTRLGDDAGIAGAWRLIADLCMYGQGNSPGQERALRQAQVHARRAGDIRLETEAVGWLGSIAFFGPTPVPEALATCRDLAAAASTPLQRTHALLWTSAVEVLSGQDSRAGVARAHAAYADLGLTVQDGSASIVHGLVELLFDDPAAAEAILREGEAELQGAGETGYRSTVLAILAEALYEQGRYDEAEEAIAASERITVPEDVFTVCLVTTVRAVLAAQAGSPEDAERHARDAMTAVGRLDGSLGRGRALLLIGEALRRVGRPGAAREAASRALAEFEHKGVAAEIRRADAMLAELATA